MVICILKFIAKNDTKGHFLNKKNNLSTRIKKETETYVRQFIKIQSKVFD